MSTGGGSEAIIAALGVKRSRRDEDTAHPFGYGSERFVYAFLAGLLLFSVGGLFALYEGMAKIRHPHRLDDPAIAVVVLVIVVSAVLVIETKSLLVGESAAVRPPEVARAIDAAEARVRAAVPSARVTYLEPDLDRDA